MIDAGQTPDRVKAAIETALDHYLASEAMHPWLIPDWHALSQTAQAGRLGHAWLLLGDPGLGKELLAERLARLHLCQQPQRASPAASVTPASCSRRAITRISAPWGLRARP